MNNVNAMIDDSSINLPSNPTLTNQCNTQQNIHRDSLNIISLNCQSILNKKEVFWELLDNHHPDIIVACETWLNQSIGDNEIISSNFKLFRRDRADGYGGVLIAVNNSIDCQALQCCNSCELCAIKILLPNNQSLIIIGVYRPPDRNNSYVESLCDAIYQIILKYPNSFICCT